MKKAIYVLTITILVLSLCSCSKTVPEVSDKTTASMSETTQIAVESTTEPTTEQTTVTTTQQDVITTEEEMTTKKVTTTRKQTNTNKAVETKTKTTTQKVASTCTNKDNHSIMCGGMGKWFGNRSELEAYYMSVAEGWNNKLDSGKITWKEYIKNCPQGYKSWSCSYCGKWTGSFKYSEKKWCTEGGNDHWLYNYEIGWYSSYSDAEKAANEYLKGHSNVDGYSVAQCDCGLYTATFYQYNN